ncbi:MAG TPA: dihydrofolate reductase [Clostridiaceae bacterium]|nr:dihydrofolate reductase [Clostridiaceae bacterium]
MIAIVNTDPGWGIGKAGALQVHISQDLQRFKKMTVGKVIIYGSKTMQTYPNGKPLPLRKNIILTRNPQPAMTGAYLADSLEELLELVEELKNDYNYRDDDFIVVGGESIYKLLLPFCTECHVTRINQELPADSYFPNLDIDREWELINQSEWLEDTKNNLRFCYLHYRRIIDNN